MVSGLMIEDRVMARGIKVTFFEFSAERIGRRSGEKRTESREQ
jgi:hypothetical protein